LRVVHFQTAESGLSGVDRVLGNAPLPRHVLRLAACFYLLQRSDDLRLTVLALAHPVLMNPKSYLRMCGSRWAGQYQRRSAPLLESKWFLGSIEISDKYDTD
jgi:hypothetical protein